MHMGCSFAPFFLDYVSSMLWISQSFSVVILGCTSCSNCCFIYLSRSCRHICIAVFFFSGRMTRIQRQTQVQMCLRSWHTCQLVMFLYLIGTWASISHWYLKIALFYLIASVSIIFWYIFW